MNAASRRLNICVIGGTGFVGTELVARLATAGHYVCVPTRALANGKHLLVLPTVELTVANVHSRRVLSRLFDGIDVVINLVADRAGPELTATLVDGMKNRRVRRFLHMSKLGASAESERAVVQAKDLLDFTIFRPSAIFGERDSLTNRFVERVRMFGGLVPLARPRTRLAPIFVDDVADAIVSALNNRATFGETYELCGPHVMTLADMVRLIARAARLRCVILPLPDFFGRSSSLPLDCVCKDNGCERLGITPRHMEGIVPLYLGAEFAHARLGR